MLKSCPKDSPKLPLIQAEQHQFSWSIFIGEGLHACDLGGLFRICSKGWCPSCVGLDELLQVSRTQPGAEGQNPSLDLQSILLLMQLRAWLSFWALRSHCQVLLSFLTTNTPSSSQGCCRSILCPDYICPCDYPSSGARPCTWPFWTSWGSQSEPLRTFTSWACHEVFLLSPSSRVYQIKT